MELIGSHVDTATLTRLLLEVGLWVVFAVALVETAVFLGLLVPAEPTVLVAALLAERGYFGVTEVALAAFTGALAGDSCGYLLGRFGGRRAILREGRLGRLWSRYEPRAREIFSRRPLYAVSGARLLSFVRTLTPWMAGMSGMPYRRFLAYDVVGVAAWAGVSVAAGYLAGESWRLVAGALGTGGALVVIGLVGAVLAGAWLRWRRDGEGG